MLTGCHGEYLSISQFKNIFHLNFDLWLWLANLFYNSAILILACDSSVTFLQFAVNFAVIMVAMVKFAHQSNFCVPILILTGDYGCRGEICSSVKFLCPHLNFDLRYASWPY